MTTIYSQENMGSQKYSSIWIWSSHPPFPTSIRGEKEFVEEFHAATQRVRSNVEQNRDIIKVYWDATIDKLKKKKKDEGVRNC